MESLNKLEELTKQIVADATKCYEKGVHSRGRSARNSLSALSKLCKEIRQEILNQMKEIEEARKKDE